MVSTSVTTHSANTITSTKNSEPFIRSKQRKASLDRTGKLITPAMDSLRERLHAEWFWKTLPLLSQMPEDQVQMLITNWPSASGIAGVLKDRLIPLSAL